MAPSPCSASGKIPARVGSVSYGWRCGPSGVHLRDRDSIPSPVAGAVGFMLHARSEVERAFADAGRSVRGELEQRELPDLFMGAFEVLVGWDAQPVPRPDLGDGPSDFRRAVRAAPGAAPDRGGT